MTTAHMMKFAEILANDPGLQEELNWRQTVADAASSRASASQLISRIVKEAGAQGLHITEADASD